jgi:hypothetical protein
MRDDFNTPNTEGFFGAQDNTRIYEREREREREEAMGFFIPTIISYQWKTCSNLGESF